MLGPALDVAPALHLMQAARSSRIGSCEGSPFTIHIDRPGIPAPLREEFELVGFRMIAPDRLPQKRDIPYVSRRGASMDPVDPAVRPRLQTVRQRVGILQAKPLQTHLRSTIGHPIPDDISI